MKRIILLCILLVFMAVGVSVANQATVSWDQVTRNVDDTLCTDLAGYKLYMGTSGGVYLKTFDIAMGQDTFMQCTTNTDPGCTQRSFTISGLVPDTYYFVATAYNTSGNESTYSNEVSKAFVADGTLPQDVLNFTASSTYAGGSGWTRLSWTNPPNSDFAGLMLEYSYNGSSVIHLADLTGFPGEAQTYDHANLQPGTYVYAIHARDTSGNMTHTAMATGVIEDPSAPKPTPSPSGGCFIATAAYGSYIDPHVMTLRKFRDEHLLTNAPGRLLVSAYYATSPPIADFIAKHEWARKAVQVALAPVILMILSPMTMITGLALFLLFIFCTFKAFDFLTRKRA